MKPAKIQRAVELVIVVFGDMKRYGPVSVPSWTHSVSVGMNVLKYGYPIEVVIAAVCHDLIEDTEVTGKMVEELFDGRVRFLTEACTLDPSLVEVPYGEDELFKRVVSLAQGGEIMPLVIKCADSTDNLKTNEHLPAKWQVPAYSRGCNWFAAGKEHLGDCPLLEDFAAVLERERLRLGL